MYWFHVFDLTDMDGDDVASGRASLVEVVRAEGSGCLSGDVASGARSRARAFRVPHIVHGMRLLVTEPVVL